MQSKDYRNTASNISHTDPTQIKIRELDSFSITSAAFPTRFSMVTCKQRTFHCHGGAVGVTVTCRSVRCWQCQGQFTRWEIRGQACAMS